MRFSINWFAIFFSNLFKSWFGLYKNCGQKIRYEICCEGSVIEKDNMNMKIALKEWDAIDV